MPDDVHLKFSALQLVPESGLSYEQVLDLEFDEFTELVALVRASRWKPQTRNKSEKYL